MSQGQALPELEEDHYVTHLAEVNDKDNEVVSTEDIVNDQGILLCKKGMRISKKIADRLVDHQLEKPLEDTVKLSNSISNTSLFSRFIALEEKYPDITQIQHQLKFSKECKDIFITRKLHPVLIQKLTVLDEQLPGELDKGVFCAWLAMLTAREMGMNKDEMHAAFLAGLTHDLGFVHISPDILNKKEALTPEEWRAIQSHVVVGKMILEKLPDTPSDTARAILEHHERCDGSGYPLSRNDEHLSVMGQLIGLVDSVHSIRVHQFESKQRNLVDLLPWLRMNSGTHFYTVYKAMDSILKQSCLKPGCNSETDISAMAKRLHARGTALKQAIDLMGDRDILSLAQGTEKSLISKSMYKVANHVLTMTTQSGLVKDELYTWLSNLESNPDKEALRELNEIELMLNELQWQLNNACKVCNAFIEQDKSNSSRSQKIQALAGEMHGCIEKLQA